MSAWLPVVRKVAVAIAGFGAIAGGVALLVLPGPGLVVIAIGLAILAREFPWAARLVARFKSFVGRMRAATQLVWRQLLPREARGATSS